MDRKELIHELDRIIDVGIVNAHHDKEVLQLVRERLTLIDRLYKHLNDLWLANAPDERTEREQLDKQTGIAEGLDYAMTSIIEIEEDIHNPRVLTAEELRQLPAQTIVWVDYWDGEEKKLGTMMAGMKCYDGTLVDEDACVYNDFESDMTPDRFDGSCWRFWSAKPTEEQRRTVAWNA